MAREAGSLKILLESLFKGFHTLGIRSQGSSWELPDF